HARPGENALNGYETMFYFGHLLNKKGRGFNAGKNNSPSKLVTSFNFQPIYLDGDKKPDYFENTRIYFLRERDGGVLPASLQILYLLISVFKCRSCYSHADSSNTLSKYSFDL